jgi:hypothetical protein
MYDKPLVSLPARYSDLAPEMRKSGLLAIQNYRRLLEFK